MATQHPAQEKTHPKYTLLYHGGIPGRGEFVRLAFEAAGVPYDDPGNAKPSRANEVYAACSPTSTGEDGNPPAFSPPMLKVDGAGDGGKPLLLSQTPNILLYLGPVLGLAGERPVDAFYVNELALAALDLNNACHDTHHPISVIQYYEDQKDEAQLRAADFREHRIPKYFSYFERVLKGNESKGHGRYMVGAFLSYADLTLWHVLAGMFYAFPNEMKAREGDYPMMFTKFYPAIKEERGIEEYLRSGRRLKFSQHGVFRHYPELDRS